MLDTEIDVTDIVMEGRPEFYSASQAELGTEAGMITWKRATCRGARSNHLDTPGKVEAFRKFLGEFGAWERSELAAFSKGELEALLVQLVCGDIREVIGDIHTIPDSELVMYTMRLFRVPEEGQILWFYMID